MAMLNNQRVGVLDAAQIHTIKRGRPLFSAKRVKNGLALTN